MSTTLQQLDIVFYFYSYQKDNKTISDQNFTFDNSSSLGEIMTVISKRHNININNIIEVSLNR